MFKNLNLASLGFNVSFPESVEAAKMGGFKGLDINVVEMEELVKKSASEIRLLLSNEGLKFGGWGLPVNFRGDEETYRKDLERLPKYTQVAVELGCKDVFTWVLPYSDDLVFNENFQKHVTRLRPVAEILEDHGCSFGLEFVAPKTSRMKHKYEFIYTMDGILQLCEAIGTGNLGLLLDSWHWYTSHGTIDQLKRLTGEQVVYVHINDAPAGVPVDEQIDWVRRLPGETGVINLPSFLKALKDIGYDGPVTPEPFMKELKAMSYMNAAKMAGESLDRVWKAAGID